MKALSMEYVAEATGYPIYANGSEDMITSVAIDSRQAGDGTLFFCIIGARTDAHVFLDDVRRSGCRNVVVSDSMWAERMKAAGDMNVLLVEDTTSALMQLARRYMDDWPELKKIAVTGSVGKTSTKEFIYSVLASRYKTGKTPGNLNSAWGIPLTVFSFDEDIEAAVIEIGLGYGPDMAELVDIVKPDAAVVTTIGSSHMEVFGTQDKLIDAKLRITSGFGEENALFAYEGCRYLSRTSIREHTSGDFEIVTIGGEGSADYRLSEICDRGIDGVECMLTSGERSIRLKLPVIGKHNLANAALAVAAGEFMGVDMEDGVRAVMNTVFAAGRLDVLKNESFTVINDTYNASPESMKAGLDILSRSEASRRVAILGDMGELGERSLEMHREVGEHAANAGIDLLVTIGSKSTEAAEGYIHNGGRMAVCCESKAAAIEALPKLLEPGDVIIVKASRAMGLEDVSHAIIERMQ